MVSACSPWGRSASHGPPRGYLAFDLRGSLRASFGHAPPAPCFAAAVVDLGPWQTTAVGTTPLAPSFPRLERRWFGRLGLGDAPLD